MFLKSLLFLLFHVYLFFFSGRGANPNLKQVWGLGGRGNFAPKPKHEVCDPSIQACGDRRRPKVECSELSNAFGKTCNSVWYAIYRIGGSENSPHQVVWCFRLAWLGTQVLWKRRKSRGIASKDGSHISDGNPCLVLGSAAMDVSEVSFGISIMFCQAWRIACGLQLSTI